MTTYKKACNYVFEGTDKYDSHYYEENQNIHGLFWDLYEEGVVDRDGLCVFLEKKYHFYRALGTAMTLVFDEVGKTCQKCVDTVFEANSEVEDTLVELLSDDEIAEIIFSSTTDFKDRTLNMFQTWISAEEK